MICVLYALMVQQGGYEVAIIQVIRPDQLSSTNPETRDYRIDKQEVTTEMLGRR